MDGKAMGDALKLFTVVVAVSSALFGGCAVCVTQKACGYTIRIEKVEEKK